MFLGTNINIWKIILHACLHIFTTNVNPFSKCEVCHEVYVSYLIGITWWGSKRKIKPESKFSLSLDGISMLFMLKIEMNTCLLSTFDMSDIVLGIFIYIILHSPPNHTVRKISLFLIFIHNIPEPKSICTRCNKANHWHSRYTTRKGLFKRQPNEETGGQVSNLPPQNRTEWIFYNPSSWDDVHTDGKGGLMTIHEEQRSLCIEQTCM